MLTIGIYGDRDSSGEHRSHDHGVAVMRDGEFVFSCELERYTGVKHDGRLNQYLEGLLEPWLSLGERIHWVLVNSFMSNQFVSDGGKVILNKKISLPVENILYRVDDSYSVLTHEIAHIASCLPFYGSFKPDSLLIHIDGGASKSSASAWYFDGKEIKHLDHSWHPELKVAVNNFNANPLSAKILGVDLSDHLGMPGKLMGLASFGKYSKNLHDSLKSNNWYFDEPNVVDITGTRGADIASCMQRELEGQVLLYIREFKHKTGAKILYYSGGAALNIHANVRVERELGFDAIHIPPSPSDCGLALGAASYFEWINGKQIKTCSAFINSSFSAGNEVTNDGIAVLDDTESVAELIARGEIVAVFAGNGETGPRALGHRSLLARPDSIAIRKKLSEEMKQREWYRPVAPMMLPHIALSALENYCTDSNLSRYMLGAWSVVVKWQKSFSGCIHADGTVRAQVVYDLPETSHIYQLLTLLNNKYEICGAINTSFNSRGVPIVNTYSQALCEAKRLGVKYLWSPSVPEVFYGSNNRKFTKEAM